jgi:DNA polymerase type B, organellar and viral
MVTDTVCNNCGNTFSAKNSRVKYCSRACQRTASKNKRRDTKRANHELEFIGVDGEGVDRPTGRHEYVMLSVGQETLYHHDGRELSYGEIFSFLWEQYLKNKNAVFVGFFLGYDFIEWTKGLDEQAARDLWTKEGIAKRKPRNQKNHQFFPVLVNGEWELDILAGRRFRLRPHTCHGMRFNPLKCHCGKDVEFDFNIEDTEEVEDLDSFWDDQNSNEEVEIKISSKRKNHPWMYICDTGPFWQCSLMSALNPKNWPSPVVTDEEYAVLKTGKATRSRIVEYGDTECYAEMIRYNQLENDVLARITTVLNNGFTKAGVRISASDWYGPGRAASIWMDTLCKELPEGESFKRVDIEECVPEWARDMGRKTYYGGWFEQFMHGYVPGTTFEYDINSAYPFVISTLPCLIHGRWEHGEGEPHYSRGSYYMLHCEVQGSDPIIGAMPFRTKQGHIMRPSHCEGYYWKHEIDAAIAAGVIDTVRVIDYVAYHPCDCDAPLRSIADLYQMRLQVGKDTPEGKAYKLLYNSAYGKMAQSIGAPKFSNSIYASLITAGCRTMILEAIATHPEQSKAVTMIATDGIYFRTAHPSLDLSDTVLGKWGMKEKRNLTQFMPGLYWDDKLRKVVEEERATGITADKLPGKTRGVNVRDLADCVHELDLQFNSAWDTLLDGKAYVWPTFSIPVRFDLVSCGQALARGKWHTAGTVHGEHHNPSCPPDCTKGSKTITAVPINKRDVSSVWPRADHDVVRSGVYREGDKLVSTDYDKQFGADLAERQLKDDIITPDGGDYLAWYFRESGDID